MVRHKTLSVLSLQLLSLKITLDTQGAPTLQLIRNAQQIIHPGPLDVPPLNPRTTVRVMDCGFKPCLADA